MTLVPPDLLYSPVHRTLYIGVGMKTPFLTPMSSWAPAMLSLNIITTGPLLKLKAPSLLRTTHFCSFSSTQITMSSTMIEHIVLFKLRPTATPSEVSSMMSNLNSLTSLPMVRHLSAGPLHRDLSTSPLSFTHMLHSRYSTKDDLAAYSAHPDHVHVVKTFGQPISDDVMAVDWVAHVPQPAIQPGSALRIQFLKLKEGLGESEKGEVLEVIGGMKEKLGGYGIQELTFGENFSPGRAKGFQIASLAVFKGVSELEAAVKDVGIEKEKDKVREYIDSLVIVDYVVPSSTQNANL